MELSDRIIWLERRLAALEANRGASLRFGTVTEVSPDGSARVQLPDGDGMVSHPLRTLQRRTLKDKEQHLPEVGEPVACLFSGQGLECGVILGAIYSDANPGPSRQGQTRHYRFEDGTVIEYDKAAHKLTAEIKGDADVRCTGEAVVQADKDVTAKSGQKLILEGRAGVRMRGPSIIFEGVDGGSCDASINADLRIRGQVTHTGDLSQTGSQAVNGSVSATGVVSGNPVVGCRH